MNEMLFMPSLHGWPFANAFPDEANPPGPGSPLAESFGLCGGMCWAALDRWLAGRRIDPAAGRPEPGDPLFAEFAQRQNDVLSSEVRRRALDWQSRPDRRRLFGRAGVAELTRKELPGLRRKLDAGEPVLLCLIRAAAPSASAPESPQLLAYRYAHDRKAGRLTLWIYDPGRPQDDEFRLVLAMRRRGRPLDATLTGGDPVRGFFAIPYDRPRPPELVGELFSDRSRVTLDRPILGRPVPVLDRRGRIHLFGRDGDGNLVHFRRRPGPYWEYETPTEHRKLGSEQRFHGAPVVALGPGRGLAVFARNYVGDLIHYRWSPGRGWSAANLTDNRRIGLQFRIEGEPAALAGPGRRLDAFARNREGHLIHYEWLPLRGWSATDLMDRRGAAAAGELRGDPVAVAGPDRTQHVFGRNHSGDVVHWHRVPGKEWVAERVPARGEAGERLRIAGDPVLAPARDGWMDVFCRGEAGELVRLRRSRREGWIARPVPAPPGGAAGDGRVQSDPAILVEPGGMVHIFARSDAGDLLHWHRPSAGAGWNAENLAASRPAIGGAYRFEGAPVPVAGPGTALHVFARSGGDLLLFAWRPDLDWTAENFTAERRAIGERYRIAGQPTALTGADGLPHLFGMDATGTIIHIETPPKRSRRGGQTRKPRSLSRARRRVPAADSRPRARTTAAARRSERDENEPVQELPLLDAAPEPADEAATPPDLPWPDGFATHRPPEGDEWARESWVADGPVVEPLALDGRVGDAPPGDPPTDEGEESGLLPPEHGVREPLALDGLVRDRPAPDGPAPEPPEPGGLLPEPLELDGLLPEEAMPPANEPPQDTEAHEEPPALPAWMTEVTRSGFPKANDEDPVDVHLLDLSELLQEEIPGPAGSSGDSRPPKNAASTGQPPEKKRKAPPDLPPWLQLDDDEPASG